MASDFMYSGSGPNIGYDYQGGRRGRQYGGRAVPYGSYRRSSGPDGVTETETVPVPVSPSEPQQLPQIRSGGQGMASGSWRDNPNGAGVIQPGLVHRTGTIPGFATPQQNVPFQSAAQLPGGGTAPGTSPTPVYNKNQHTLLEKQYARAHQAYMDSARAYQQGAIDEDGLASAKTARDTAAKSVSDYEQQFLPGANAGGGQTTSGMVVPFHPMGGGAAPGATGAPATPYQPTRPGESAPGVPLPPSDSYVRRGPALQPEAPLSKSDRDQRVKAMYDAAGEGFARQSQQIEDTPTAQPGDADRLGTLKSAAAAGAGGATQRNAIARGKQLAGDTAGVAKMQQDEGQLRADRSAVQGEIGDIETRQQASTPQATAARKGQLAQNDASLDAIRQREGQFDNGDYSLQQPLVPYSGGVAGSNGPAPAPAPTPYTPQPPAASPAQPAQMAAQAKANGAVVKGPRAGGQSAVVQPHAPAATQPAQQASGSFLSAGASASGAGPDASVSSLPPEAHAAAQKVGGQVQSDGTMTTPDGKRWVRGVKGSKTGWQLAG
jgi:hypothetical protein